MKTKLYLVILMTMFVYGCRHNSTSYVYSSSYEDDYEEDIELNVQDDEEENDSYDEDSEYLSSDIEENSWYEEEQESEKNEEVDSYDEYDSSSDDSYLLQEYDAVVPMVLCPMCRGNRLILSFNTDKYIPCTACKGSGQVSAELMKQLEEAGNMGRELADEFLGIGTGGTSSGYSGQMGGTGMRSSRQLIESQIGMLEQQVAMHEQGLANCESITLQSQYRNIITELQYQIRNLKIQLQGME